MEEEKKEPIEVSEEIKVRPLRKAVKEKYPDFAPENESEWNDKEDEYFNEMSDYNRTYRDAEAKLDELISTDPELADVLNSMIVDKAPFRVAIAKHYSQEDLIPKEGEDDFDAWQSAYQERVNKKTARDKRDKEIADNESASMDAIDKFAEENGMDESGKNALIEYINGIFSDMLYKKLTPESLKAFHNALNHDRDVTSAAEAAEIKGRNASIEAEMEKEDSAEAGDGIPAIDKGATPQDEPKPSGKTMLDDIIGRKKF